MTTSRDGIIDRIKIGDWCTLYHGNSMELIDRILRDHMPKSVVTDPPYGMNFRSNRRAVRYDSIIGDQDIEALRFAVSIPAPHSKYIFLRWQSLVALSTPPKSIITWIKNNHGSGDLQHAHGSQTEIAAFYPGGQHQFPGTRPSDIVFARKSMNKNHPTEKPVDLMRTIVSWTSGLVLDPFFGSGSTALACKMEGRQFVGVEIERSWFEFAAERIDRLTSDGPLFEAGWR